MKFLLFAVLYIIVGAAISSAYYFIQLKTQERWDDELFAPILIGIFWPAAAPFAFGFCYARHLSENKGRWKQ